ncbi:MAG: T9SS C-terminal target domain-containing protein [Porphyromonadaceae bacterium]|nr:MAG: T9SS C-terminal target domain-containing protein [Porphyromonadaceae bacterium]
MKSFINSLIIILITSLAAFTQNRETFFKTIPAVDESTPEWARLMYSPNPNIKQVDFEYEKYFENHPMEKTIHTQNYKHWRRQVDRFINSDGYIILPDAGEEEVFLKKLEQRSKLKSGSAGTWRQIGPFTTFANGDLPDLEVSWQANVYCFDQSDSRPDILFAGTESGGLFKSDNKGLNWRLVTASVPVSTISDVKISALNPDVVFFAANNRIYKTSNGGETWSEVFLIGDEAFQMLIHPTNPDIVFCAANNGLYRSIDSGAVWTKIFSQKCWDIKFHPLNTTVVYLAKDNPTAKKCEFWKSNDAGATFTIRENGWYVPTTLASATDIGAKIGITPASPELVYVALIGESKAGDNGWIGLYKSTDGGENWVNPDLPDGGPYTAGHPNPASINPDGTGFHQGFYDFSLGVSQSDPARLWLGTINFLKSSNGGASWTRIGSYNAQQDIGWVHPDIQDLHVRGNEIFLCTDGGISYSTDELRTHEARNYGLAGSDYWGFGQGWNEDVLVGGRYHNGNSGYYQTYGTGNTIRLGGAEASTGYVNPMENRKTYFSDISSALLPKVIDDPVIYFQKLGKYPLENYTESYSSEIEWDPRYAGHLYLGEGGKIWKSTNGGGYFEALFSFGTGKVLEIEVSRSNPKVIYCVYQPKGGYWDPCSIRKTIDGGKTWTSTTAVPTNDRWRMEITLNPENENELWVISLNGYNGRKVFRTIDGGTTWEPKNSSLLDDEKTLDIQFQGGTDGVVYLATATGAYYYDPATSAWVEFMTDLPVWTRVMEMKPFYAAGKIRMATGGRGIWETDLAEPFRPLAQPMTQSDIIYNSNDTVQFESYSIVRNDGAQWLWSFSPAPLYVSSTTVRNPKVVFGAKGSFDVTLTVTDSENRTSSKTVPSMVTIIDPAGPDAFAGQALECKLSGEFAVTEDLALNTNILTITAWVKPDGIQPDYTGIVMNNGTGAGINFRGGNNTLGYHWPGGYWGWDSKLNVPSGRWSHVALVANASSMTLYVNGIPSKHTSTLQKTDIATMDIGSYMGWTDRNFKGMIDEVCIWKRALTQEEIREHAHLTKENLKPDPDFIAYYQFNEPGGNLFNRMGSGMGSLMGAPQKVESSAPVGTGASCRLPVISSGNFDFTGTGLLLTFPAGGALYPGEMVVTRLQNLPVIMPNANPNIGCYWLLNAYGSDHFTPVSEMRFAPFTGEPSDTIIASPAHANLFLRRIGETTNTWETLCGATSVTPGPTGSFRYTSSCTVSINGSLFLASDNINIPLLKRTTSGIGDVRDPGESFVHVYPNPVSPESDIRFEYPGTGPIRIKLFDSTGKLLKDIRTNGPCIEIIPATGLPSGICFYTVQSDTKMRSGRVVIL